MNDFKIGDSVRCVNLGADGKIVGIIDAKQRGKSMFFYNVELKKHVVILSKADDLELINESQIIR